MDIADRQAKITDDNLKVYKGIIYKVLGPEDDRLQVKIIPYMKDISVDELDNLPKYPMFFKGQKITGHDLYTYGDKKADFVYVLATSDFTVGYVLGLANEFETQGEAAFTGSASISSVKRYLAQRGALPSEFESSDIVVLINSVEKDKGGILALYNYRTGDFFILNSSGTFATIQTDSVMIRAGSPSQDGTTKVNSSTIKLTADKIEIKTPFLEVDSPKIVLGHNNMKLCGTNSLIGVPVDGTVLMPIEGITV